MEVNDAFWRLTIRRVSPALTWQVGGLCSVTTHSLIWHMGVVTNPVGGCRFQFSCFTRLCYEEVLRWGKTEVA